MSDVLNQLREMAERLAGMWVLLVEDDPDLQEIAREVFSTNGLQFLVASNGHQALKILRASEQSAPTHIILDLCMPVMGGREFLETIHKIPKLQDIPVIVVSVLEMGPDYRAVRSHPQVVAYVLKPKGLDAYKALVRMVAGTNSR